MVTDEEVRAVFTREFERKGAITPHGLSIKTGLPQSTIYQALNAKRAVRLSLNVVGQMLDGMGRSLSWLETEAKKVRRKSPKTA